jgi:hypothetical protein
VGFGVSHDIRWYFLGYGLSVFPCDFRLFRKLLSVEVARLETLLWFARELLEFNSQF